MEITPEEFTQLANAVNKSVTKAHEDGAESEQHRDMPKTLFESLLKHAEKSKTLVEYEYSKGSKWIQVKPERDGSKGIDYVEIGFAEDGMSMDVICVQPKL